jgi:hypothetical protein
VAIYDYSQNHTDDQRFYHHSERMVVAAKPQAFSAISTLTINDSRKCYCVDIGDKHQKEDSTVYTISIGKDDDDDETYHIGAKKSSLRHSLTLPASGRHPVSKEINYTKVGVSIIIIVFSCMFWSQIRYHLRKYATVKVDPSLPWITKSSNTPLIVLNNEDFFVVSTLIPLNKFGLEAQLQGGIS